jgi:hypothetical protein
MIMLLARDWIDPPPARHSEVEQEYIMPVSVDEAIFCPSIKLQHSGAGKSLPKVLWEWSPQIGPGDFHIGDTPAREHPLQTADGGFDFRKLGHIRDMAKTGHPR